MARFEPIAKRTENLADPKGLKNFPVGSGQGGMSESFGGKPFTRPLGRCLPDNINRGVNHVAGKGVVNFKDKFPAGFL